MSKAIHAFDGAMTSINAPDTTRYVPKEEMVRMEARALITRHQRGERLTPDQATKVNREQALQSLDDVLKRIDEEASNPIVALKTAVGFLLGEMASRGAGQYLKRYELEERVGAVELRALSTAKIMSANRPRVRVSAGRRQLKP
ncbi:hypothetical protein NKI12_08100 [Mesorhizobium australicum]|uniref:Uncharacterized protein n=1 Tax=Mesorhizobium australicum TaxID=536018 RepID=A0ACC6SVQ8_9HYPH